MEISIDVPAPFVELFEPSKNWRHIAYHGGRSSGKSTTVALALVAKATSTPLRILCTREFQASLNDSVYKLWPTLSININSLIGRLVENTLEMPMAQSSCLLVLGTMCNLSKVWKESIYVGGRRPLLFRPSL